VARPRIAASSETRLLDGTLVAGLVVIALQLVPLPPTARALLSPAADGVRTALRLFPAETEGWHPLTVAPGATAYALALLAAALVVFWAARQACGRGATRPLVRAIAFIGLAAALVAITPQASAPGLIYGRWPTHDLGARPFGPFVNRNHFAAWVVMAFPLAIGYMAARISAHRPSPRLSGEIAALLQGLGSSALWAGVAGAVMTLSLVASASRSGLIAFAGSLAGGLLIGRRRLTRRGRWIGLVGLVLLAGCVAAYANFGPVLMRVEETIAVGAGERPAIWRETLRIVRDFLLVGTGLGGYRTVMVIYQQMDRTFFINQAHNQYLQWLAEGGVLLAVPALAAVAAFARLFFVRLARDLSPSAWLRLGGATALAGVAIQGAWETALRLPANGLLFAVAAAVAVHRPTDNASSHGSSM
jgi:hypothetical protein